MIGDEHFVGAAAAASNHPLLGSIVA